MFHFTHPLVRTRTYLCHYHLYNYHYFIFFLREVVYLVCTCTFVLLIRSFSFLPPISLRSSPPLPYYFLMSSPPTYYFPLLSHYFPLPTHYFPLLPHCFPLLFLLQPLLCCPQLSSSTTFFSQDGSISGPSGVNPGPVEDTDGSCLRNEHDGKLTQVHFPLSC